MTEKSVDYVRSRKGQTKPFFLYVPFPSPHAPIIPNDEFDGKSAAGPYGDFVVQTDDACGRILKAIEEIGATENTIVIFSSDNGPEFYAYQRDQKYDHWSAAPLRGLKQDIYEGGHHVLYIIKWPAVTKMGAVSDVLVSQVDIIATVASAIGYELPAASAEDSFDFLPYLKGAVENGPRTSMVHNTKANHYALRDGDWLLIAAKTGYLRQAPADWNKKHKQPADDKQAVELYNLKQDIQQRHNLAEKHSDKIASMQALLKKLREQGHSAPRLD